MSKKTALVTGASVGIGRATAIALASEGYQLILLARRQKKLAELAAELSPTPCHLIACDINDHAVLDAELDALPQDFAAIDVLVNNAGLALGVKEANKSLWQDWKIMIDTNCLSLSYLTHKLLPGMVERNRGHILNLGSIAGTYAYKGGNVYGATKAFVEQFSLNLRADLLGTQVHVCVLQPGMLGDTEFSLVRMHGDQSAADSVYAGAEALTPEDVGEAIRWVVCLPAHVNINRMEIMPVCQAPVGFSVARNTGD